MREAAIDTHRSTARGAGRSRTPGAPPLDDMVGEGPVARAAPRRGVITSAAVAAQRLGGGRSPGAAARGQGGAGFAGRLIARVPRIAPLKALTVAAFGVALVGIVANAMVFQRGPHPSPLFGLGRSVDGASEMAALPPPAPPVPAERTGTIPPTPAVPTVAAPPVAAAAPKPAPVHHAVAKVHHEDAAKAKLAETAVAHPRPGHTAPAHTSSVPPAPAHATTEAKSEARSEPKAATKSEAKADPVTKLLAGGAHPAKAELKAPPAAKPNAKAAAAPPSQPPHHGFAAASPAQGAKPTAQAE